MTRSRSDERWRLLARSAWCAAASVVVYVLMVRTGVGQHLDDLAFEGRKAIRLEVRRAAAAAMRLLVPALTVAVPVAAVVDGLRRRSVRTAALVVGATGVTVVVSRVLKELLPRTDVASTWAGPANTYPSGHAATVLVLSMGVLAIRPRRWPPARVTAATTAAAAVLLSALLGSGWHRPSDVLGALFLGAAVFSLGAAIASPPSLPIPEALPQPGRWLAVLAGSAVLATLLFRYPVAVPQHPLPAFAVALVLTDVCAAALLWSQGYVLGPLDDVEPA